MSADAKVYTQGTHRVRVPEETWEIIRPLFGRFGVTRIADVTGLDVFGIPVVMAVRPLSWTLSVSQGKGQNLLLAKVSGAMEAIELWHAERAHPPVTHAGATADELGVPYRLEDLGAIKSPLVGDDTPLDWVTARSLRTGAEVPVPRDVVCFRDPSVHQWSPGWIRANSNGLASGNSVEEAILHAMYEVVERDSLSRPTMADYLAAPTIDPATITDGTCRSMVDKITAADGRISMHMLPSAFGVPTFRCVVWSWDFPLVCNGFGAHLDPAVALSRAITEAAQGRLATIAGSRDDLEHFHDRLDKPQRRIEYLAAFPEPDTDFAEVARRHTLSFDNTTDELAWLSDLIAAELGAEVLVVDLSTHEDFAVVKVVAPGGRLDVTRVHPRAERSA